MLGPDLDAKMARSRRSEWWTQRSRLAIVARGRREPEALCGHHPLTRNHLAGRAPQVLAAEGAVETTAVRLAKSPPIWIAPIYVAASSSPTMPIGDLSASSNARWRC